MINQPRKPLIQNGLRGSSPIIRLETRDISHLNNGIMEKIEKSLIKEKSYMRKHVKNIQKGGQKG